MSRAWAWGLPALLFCLPSVALAQRELHWDAIDVTAHLDAAGTLHVTELQTMVFTGEWNGGERRFSLHPRHRFTLLDIARISNGEWQALTEDADLDDRDEYAWVDRTTLRWRSRRPTDPPFSRTVIRYELRYTLSGILLTAGDRYRLDHDFAFRDRAGSIGRFALKLTFDPGWEPPPDVRETYTAGPLPPGDTFALDLLLRYTGAGTPATLDLSRPPAIVAGVSVLLGLAGLGLLWFFAREQRLGRFAPLPAGDVAEAWLRERVLAHPAEVIGAVWDETIARPEVVSLIARLESEGILESEVGRPSGKARSMTLRLKKDRSALVEHERALVDGLFFDGRTETSTAAVKAHYRTKGFNPIEVIRPGLEAAVDRLVPAGAKHETSKRTVKIAFAAGIGLFLLALARGQLHTLSVATLITAFVLTGVAAVAGAVFRTRVDWGRRAALLCLLPALAIAGGVAALLWFYAGTGRMDLPPFALAAMVGIAAMLTGISIRALASRRTREAMTFRKGLAAARAFFAAELRKPQPALRDDWYPWLLAFGLAKQMDDWSARQEGERTTRDRGTRATARPSSPTSAASSSSPTWTGFAGGRSGGAGGGAAWQAAAGGMAGAVVPPSSSGSRGGSGGGGGGGSSSSSSGGGGGGGW